MPLNRTQRKTVRRPSGHRTPIRMLIHTGFTEFFDPILSRLCCFFGPVVSCNRCMKGSQCPLHARDRVVCVTLAPMTETGIDFVRTNTAATEGCGAVILVRWLEVITINCRHGAVLSFLHSGYACTRLDAHRRPSPFHLVFEVTGSASRSLPDMVRDQRRDAMSMTNRYLTSLLSSRS